MYLTQKTKKMCNDMPIRRFGKYSFQILLGLNKKKTKVLFTSHCRRQNFSPSLLQQWFCLLQRLVNSTLVGPSIFSEVLDWAYLLLFDICRRMIWLSRASICFWSFATSEVCLFSNSSIWDCNINSKRKSIFFSLDSLKVGWFQKELTGSKKYSKKLSLTI